MKAEDIYEYDKASGHLFCKYCGVNYLSNIKHEEDCCILKRSNQKREKDK